MAYNVRTLSSDTGILYRLPRTAPTEAAFVAAATERIRRERLAIEAHNAALRSLVERQAHLIQILETALQEATSAARA